MEIIVNGVDAYKLIYGAVQEKGAYGIVVLVGDFVEQAGMGRRDQTTPCHDGDIAFIDGESCLIGMYSAHHNVIYVNGQFRELSAMPLPDGFGGSRKLAIELVRLFDKDLGAILEIYERRHYP